MTGYIMCLSVEVGMLEMFLATRYQFPFDKIASVHLKEEMKIRDM